MNFVLAPADSDSLAVLPVSQADLVSRADLPALVKHAGRRAAEVTLEFFTAHIRNKNTRMAYLRAVRHFSDWCGSMHYEMADLTPIHVAAYIEGLTSQASAPTVKQHLAAVRMLFDHWVRAGILRMNPATAVRGPKHVVKKGKTPVLTAEEAKQLLESIDTSSLVGLRDKALIATMVYSFARISAVVGMKVEDYFQIGHRRFIRLHEKGGKEHEVPAHHQITEALGAYMDAVGIEGDRKGPLFRTFKGKTQQITDKPMSRTDALRMIYRRAAASGIPGDVCCHTFRATGITVYLQNGGSLEVAQQIAAHESPRTTKLYDRTKDELTLDEIERIRL